MSDEQGACMSEESIWSGDFSEWKGEEFRAEIVLADDSPGALRVTLHKDGAVRAGILVSPQQLGEFFQRLAETASRLADPDASPETDTTDGRRIPDRGGTGVTVNVGSTGGRRIPIRGRDG